MKKLRIASIAIFHSLAFTAACNTTEPLEIPASVNPANVSIIETPVEDQASFALGAIVATIKRGTQIINFPASGVKGVNSTLCNQKYTGKVSVEWGTGSSYLGDWRSELGELYFDTMSDMGLNIKGDPRNLFSQKKEAQSAEYKIGARIKEIRGNACEDHHWWDGTPLGKFSGEMYMKVEWSIYSNLRKDTVYATTTDGYYLLKEPKSQGLEILMHESFADAASYLVGDSDFVSIANNTYSGKEGIVTTGEPIAIDFPKDEERDIAKDIDEILSAVVTVRVGGGHGSGFFISNDGYLLTNAHVVSDSKTVMVVLSNGLEVEGSVERVHEPRDVALIKVPIRVPSALNVRDQDVELMEPVVVIGSPIDEGLQSTVTRGIVSAQRKLAQDDYRYIQSDVAVSGGNSGGPMLDSKGKVVAITVASIKPDVSESLNLFIPIVEALKELQILPYANLGG